MKPEKVEFIEKLTNFICNEMAGKSIMLEVEQRRSGIADIMPKFAAEWADIKSAVPGLQGYPSRYEVRTALEKLLA